MYGVCTGVCIDDSRDDCAQEIFHLLSVFDFWRVRELCVERICRIVDVAVAWSFDGRTLLSVTFCESSTRLLLFEG